MQCVLVSAVCFRQEGQYLSETSCWVKHGHMGCCGGGFCWINLKTLCRPLSFSQLKSCSHRYVAVIWELNTDTQLCYASLDGSTAWGFDSKCWFQTTSSMMFSKKWGISKSSSQAGLAFTMTVSSSGVRDRFPISVMVPDFFPHAHTGIYSF